MRPVPDRFKPRLAKLRELRRELRELETNPPPRTDPLDAFRNAMRPSLENLARVDIRQPSAESHFVNGFKPYIQDLAAIYQVSRQGMYCVMKSNALTRHDLLQPDYVFQRLLDLGRQSPLRTRLSSPATRAKVSKLIAAL